MIKPLAIALAFASVATAGITSAPAAAHDYYDRGEYRQVYQDQGENGNPDGDGYRGYQQRSYEQDSRNQNYREQQAYQRYQQQRRAQYARRYRSDGYAQYDGRGGQDYAYRGGYPQHQIYYRGQRCKSGTTGAILGALAGGLLGREIGRGGRYNDPSTTGLILGAGGGALAGRAIERSGNDCR